MLRRFFTLIELLVVIAIIAISASMLMAALQPTRYRAERAACTSQIRQMGQILSMYSTDNNGYMPHGATSGDVFQALEDEGYLENRELMRCPGDPAEVDEIVLTDKDTVSYWIDPKAPQDRDPMRAIYSDNPTTGNHVGGVNVLFADGHVEFVEPSSVFVFDGYADGIELEGTQSEFQHFLEGVGTISLLVRPDTLTEEREFALSADGQVTGGDVDLNIGRDEGAWWVSLSDGTSGYRILERRNVDIPEADRWYHLTVVLGGSGRGLYVDGDLKSSWDDFTGQTGDWKYNFHVGRSPDRGPGDRHWSGAVSQVRFFDTNLSESEVGEVLGREENLVGYWPLIGGGTEDFSNNDHHGMIIGDPSEDTEGDLIESYAIESYVNPYTGAPLYGNIRWE